MTVHLFTYIIHSNATLIYTSSLPYTISHIRNLFYNQWWFHHNFHHALHHAVWVTPSVTLFPLCFAGHAFHSAFHNVFRNAFRYEKPRYVRDGGVLRCIRLVRYAMWLTVCGWRHVTDGVSWQRVGDAMSVKECGWRYVGDGALAYTLELELDSEVGKWIAHVSVLYDTVSTHATCRHGDDTPIKLYVTQLFLLRFHNAFRIKILSRANFRPDASATVALENCRLVSMYISDRKRRVQWKC